MRGVVFKRLAMALAMSQLVLCAATHLHLASSMSLPALSLVTVVQFLPLAGFVNFYDFRSLSDFIPNLLSGIKSVFLPRTISATLYSIFTLTAVYYTAQCLLVPSQLTKGVLIEPIHDEVNFFLTRGLGALALLMSMTFYLLKEAADRRLLGTAPFPVLNLAIAMECLAKLGIVVLMYGLFYLEGKSIGVLKGWSLVAEFVVYGGFAFVCGLHFLLANESLTVK